MRYFSFLLLLLVSVSTTFSQRTLHSSSDILLEMEKLGFMGNVLYLAAHPDDENTRLIAWLENDKLARTAYMSLTRGDGGQNLIGTEIGAATGILRTQELLEARKIDGGEQFFSRAVDFGYSKTAKETFEIWNKEAILSDVVWIIRKFRPDVIITRFPPDERAGHGHHTASTILAEMAFDSAASKTAFPEQLQYVEPWQSTRLLWNASNWWNKNLDKIAENNPDYLTIDIGDYNEILGFSYSELAAESRSQHKSQGFGSAKTRGSQKEFLKHMAGQKADKNLFSGVKTSWSKYDGGKGIDEKLHSIISNFDAKTPSSSVTALVDLYKEINKIEQNAEIDNKLDDLKRIIKACLGIHAEAIASSAEIVVGQKIKGDFIIVNRSDFPVEFSVNSTSSKKSKLPFNENQIVEFESDPITHISQPYWLTEPYFGIFSVEDQEKIGLPENKASYGVSYSLTINGITLDYYEPVQYKWTHRVSGENYRDVVVNPKVSISIPEPVYVFADAAPQSISVSVQIHQADFQGSIVPQLAEGWKIQPQNIELGKGIKSAEQVFQFIITPPAIASNCELAFTVISDGDKVGS